ncbi:hypothetical protein EHJ11_18675 [Cronobacter turicensis]|uniref:hypothetical protein n=1 Tax=Cronobacter turicensis TaxID=413502 RepID=UPI001375FE8A|nr:hypothetical protein [Cronobacter turicensis]NCH64842.1 hypothetical protein [Cronobacter turicensis]
MTIDTAKLKAAAEKAKDNFSPNFVVSTRDVLELIAALEAAEKLNAELDERLLRYAGIATQRAEHVAELEKRVAVLTGALNQTVSGYKSCLRTGHDRIIELGGACDAPETMIAGNPDIRQAEKLLSAGINLETGGEA